MAMYRLAVRPLSRNDISELAQLFELSFDNFVNPAVLFYEDFLSSLRTLVGLGFTAALADRDLFQNYYQYLKQFLTYNEGDFRKHSEAKTSLAKVSANMVEIAAMSFSALQCPSYYQAFLDALRSILYELRFTEYYQKVNPLLAKLEQV